jgi:hypothetical protein
MNKTQLLSATENLIYCLGKNTIFIMKQNRLLDTAISQEQVPPEMENRKFSPCFISVDTFTINTLLLHKYIKDSQI